MNPGDIFCAQCGQYHASLSMCPNQGQVTWSNGMRPIIGGVERRRGTDRRTPPADAGLREDVAELTAAVSENEPKIQALIFALRYVAQKGHYGAETAMIIDKALLPFTGIALVADLADDPDPLCDICNDTGEITVYEDGGMAIGTAACPRGCKAPPAPQTAERWKVKCGTCGATEEGSADEVPLRLHGRLQNGEWQHYVGNAFTATEWCGPVSRVVGAGEGKP